MKFFVYILESINFGTFYIGQTNNLADRFKRHNNGNIKSTKPKRPYRLCYFEEFKTRSTAMNRECEIKKKYNTDRRRKMVLSFDKNKLVQFSGL